MREAISDVESLIAALGGPAEAARLLGEAKGTIDIWRHRQAIPARNYLAHQQVLAGRGLAASASIWRMKSPAPAH